MNIKQAHDENAVITEGHVCLPTLSGIAVVQGTHRFLAYLCGECDAVHMTIVCDNPPIQVTMNLKHDEAERAAAMLQNPMLDTDI